MKTAEDYGLDIENTIRKICTFFRFEKPNINSCTTNEIIKELCVARLCKSVGLTGKYNYKSEFFEFFSNIMGEAVCEKLSIKTHIASDELRFVKYERINLISEIKSKLPFDCLTATMFEYSFAKNAIVLGAMSIPVLPGMLYKITGISTLFAIAPKCSIKPCCDGLL